MKAKWLETFCGCFRCQSVCSRWLDVSTNFSWVCQSLSDEVHSDYLLFHRSMRSIAMKCTHWKHAFLFWFQPMIFFSVVQRKNTPRNSFLLIDFICCIEVHFIHSIHPTDGNVTHRLPKSSVVFIRPGRLPTRSLARLLGRSFNFPVISSDTVLLSLIPISP